MDKIQVDRELTPENCEKKGFIWWKDSIYDPKAPKPANEEFTHITKKGWRLGEPASKELEQNGGVGIYKPLKSKNT
jgi:hypothetical protein